MCTAPTDHDHNPNHCQMILAKFIVQQWFKNDKNKTSKLE